MITELAYTGTIHVYEIYVCNIIRAHSYLGDYKGGSSVVGIRGRSNWSTNYLTSAMVPILLLYLCMRGRSGVSVR